MHAPEVAERVGRVGGPEHNPDPVVSAVGLPTRMALHVGGGRVVKLHAPFGGGHHLPHNRARHAGTGGIGCGDVRARKMRSHSAQIQAHTHCGGPDRRSYSVIDAPAATRWLMKGLMKRLKHASSRGPPVHQTGSRPRRRRRTGQRTAQAWHALRGSRAPGVVRRVRKECRSRNVPLACSLLRQGLFLPAQPGLINAYTRRATIRLGQQEPQVNSASRTRGITQRGALGARGAHAARCAGSACGRPCLAAGTTGSCLGPAPATGWWRRG